MDADANADADTDAEADAGGIAIALLHLSAGALKRMQNVRLTYSKRVNRVMQV